MSQPRKSQQQPREKIVFRVSKDTPWRNNIIIPEKFDAHIDWKPITVAYKPKTRRTRTDSGLVFQDTPQEYKFNALGFAHPVKQAIILKPISFQQKAEFQQIFGKHSSMQALNSAHPVRITFEFFQI